MPVSGNEAPDSIENLRSLGRVRRQLECEVAHFDIGRSEALGAFVGGLFDIT